MIWYKIQIKSRIGQKSARDISKEDLVDLMHEMKEKSCRKNISWQHILFVVKCFI